MPKTKSSIWTLSLIVTKRAFEIFQIIYSNLKYILPNHSAILSERQREYRQVNGRRPF